MSNLRKASGLGRLRYFWTLVKIETRLIFEQVFHPARYKEVSKKIDALTDEEAFQMAVEALRRWA